MKTIIALICILCLSSLKSGGNNVLYAQTQFQITVGGTHYEIANTIIQTTDGGYAVSGSTQQGTGYYDIYIVKLSSTGTLQWSKTIGESNQEHGNVIIRTSDGGYAVAGGTASFGAGNYDMYIVKLDASGDVQWARTIGGTSFDEAYSIVQTTDGGYIAAGTSNSFGAGGFDIYIAKLNASGTLQWSRILGGSSLEECRSIIQTIDGGYVVAGTTNSFGAGSNDMYIVKLDASGTLQWSRTIGGSSYEDGYSIVQSTDGSFVIAGMMNSFGAVGSEMYLAKLDNSGTIQWTKTIGGTGNDYGYSVKITTDGGYVVAGTTYSFGSISGDIYIVKLDNSGTLQWSRTIGSSSIEQVFSIIQSTDGGYAAAGYTFSFGSTSGDIYIVKFNSTGITCGNNTNAVSQSGTGGIINSQVSIVTNPSSSVTAPAPTSFASGSVTTICIAAIQPVSNLIPLTFELYQNYPNPFNPSTNIRFEIPLSRGVDAEGGRGVLTTLIVYDALGREVQTLVNQELSPGTYEVDFNGAELPSGVYYYKIESGSFIETKRMILIK